MNSLMYSLMALIRGQSGAGIFFVMSLFSTLVVVFLCLPFHEYMRGVVAHALGDNTAEEMGRLTLNPMSHLSPMGALCMALCGIGWGNPMPINLNRCRKVNLRKAYLLVSLAGPLSFILLAFIIMIISKLMLVMFTVSETIFYVIKALQNAAGCCAFLAVFNLLPIPPFDGYALIQGVLPRKAAYWMETHTQMINMIVLILLFTGFASGPLEFLSDKLLKLLDLMTSFIR